MWTVKAILLVYTFSVFPFMGIAFAKHEALPKGKYWVLHAFCDGAAKAAIFTVLVAVAYLLAVAAYTTYVVYF